MSVLLGGASGFIGSALVKSLCNSGHKTIIISRTPKGKNQISWKDIARNGLPTEVKSVVNLSGRNMAELSPAFYFGNAYSKYKADMANSRIETNQLLSKSIAEAEHNIEVFVSSSGVSFYKPDAQKDYTESSPYEDYGHYLGQLVLDWEAAALIPEKPNVRQIQVRTGVVLGRQGGMIQSIYLPYILGIGGPMGSGKQWLPWIHIDDIVGIFKHALFTPLKSGPINGTAPNPCTNRQFATSFGRALHRPSIIPVPAFMVKAMFNDRDIVMLQGQKVLPKKALDTGYKFKYADIDSACRNLF